MNIHLHVFPNTGNAPRPSSLKPNAHLYVLYNKVCFLFVAFCGVLISNEVTTDSHAMFSLTAALKGAHYLTIV